MLTNHETKSAVLSRRKATFIGILCWSLALPLLHGWLPLAVSRLAPRFGWNHDQPGWWNWIGLGVVVVCAVLFIGLVVLHFLQFPQQVHMELTPRYLLRRGPYAWTRNPMYLTMTTLWTGWSVFYGSPTVAIGCAVLLIWVNLVVRWEERRLEARFGEGYLEYKKRVPRWLW